VQTRLLIGLLAVAAPFAAVPTAWADGSGDPTAVKSEDGKYSDKDGNQTYKIQSDGTVDWFTYSGFRRYHSECQSCHGPNGNGSSFAPALKDSLKTMSFTDFTNTVVNGGKNVTTSKQSVMPPFGSNPNVRCFLDAIYVYLRARANGAVPEGRPAKHADKTKAVDEAELSCMRAK